MKAAAAIRKYINEGDGPKANMTEIRDFREACTDDEWQRFGMEACELLGETFEPSEAPKDL